MTTTGKKSKSRKALELGLLVLGVSGLSIWGWSVVQESVYEDWHNWAFDRKVRGQPEPALDYLKEKIWPPPAEQPQADESGKSTQPTVARGSSVPPTRNGLVGRLSIPRLSLRAIVREGTSDKTLSVALGHISGTALPGQNGNVAVAGHRDALFRGLRNIQMNDRIVLETGAGETYAYRVSSTEIVTPNQVSVLKAGLYPELTLVTCYPFNYVGSAPQRFIVKARQVSQSTVEKPVTNFAEAAETTTARPEPKVPVIQTRDTGVRRLPFEVVKDRSRQLAPGISIGLTHADAIRGRVDGWMWLMPDRRTIWLRDQSARDPVVFTAADGKKRELIISAVSGNSMRGYLRIY